MQAVAILQAASNPILVYRPHRGEKTIKAAKKKEIANQNERKAMTTSARPGVHLTCHVKLEAVGVVHLTELVKWEPPGCPFDKHCQMGADRGGKSI